MPDKKQQHFVPKCHLKPFSLDREAKAINLFNVNARRAIPSASVKGQCASSYFYGEDLVIENALSDLEGRYSTILRSIIDEQEISDADLDYICDFVYLQFNRTEAMLRQRKMLIEGLAERATRGRPNVQIDPLPTHLDNIREMMRLFSETNWAIADLRCVLVKNESQRDFITSDNPAVLTNRLYLQRYHDPAFGLLSSGSLLIMPLSPKWLLVLYDREAYWVERNSRHIVTIDVAQEIDALNIHQYVNCDKNVYFFDWEERNSIEHAFQNAQDCRIERAYDLQAMIPADGAPVGTMFRRANEADIVRSRHVLITFTNMYPDPKSWPAFLKYRRDGAGYTHPSLINPIRRAGLHRYDRNGFRKVRL